MCSIKSDTAPELVEAVNQFDWLPEHGLPNNLFHNAKLESNMKRIKEGTRAIHLAAGFPHELWLRNIKHFCAAKNFIILAPIHPNEAKEVKHLEWDVICYEATNGG